MPGKATTPQQVADVVAFREAGFTVAAIAARTGLSGSTVNRIIATHGSKKGAAKAEVLAAARQELRSVLTSKEAIASEAARIIADDLAQVHLLRERIANAVEHLTASNLQEAALLMRAAAAMSTAIKNSSDTVRQSLGYDKKTEDSDEDDLPVLQVIELSDEQVHELRREKEAANDEDLLAADTKVSQSCEGG